MHHFSTGFIVGFLLLSVCSIFPQGSVAQPDYGLSNRMIDAINRSDIDMLKQFIEQHGVNAPLFDSTQSLLSLSISSAKYTVAEYLLKNGADINRTFNNLSPLMQATLKNLPKMATLLLNFGADPDFFNRNRNTSLHYAARMGNTAIIKILVKHGANPFVKNFHGYTPVDYARMYGKNDAAVLLDRYMERFIRGGFSSTYDGPHVIWNGRKRISMIYLVNDSLRRRLYRSVSRFNVIDTLTVSGFEGNDTLSYSLFRINRMFQRQSEFSGVNKIVAVGDVHGAYDSLLTILRAAGVIDRNLNWCFGRGHLVFIGDLMDRGEKVTQTLWLAYRLWHQANRFGGKVHLILGNHEWLALHSDYRYLHQKYRYLTAGLAISYSELFSVHSQLGIFIRQFKAVVKVNNILFVHAGLSPSIMDEGFSIERINRIFYTILNPDLPSKYYESDLEDAAHIMLSEIGPIWYRGYLLTGPKIQKPEPADFGKVLDFYKAKAMIIGHTEVPSIRARYGGKLIPINVPFHHYGKPMQVLLIERGKYFAVYSNGRRILLSQ